MIALVGDAEIDEGNIFEAMLEGWKQGLRNCWWVIDYNRQSLDAVVREGLWERYEPLFKNFGWDVVIVKYGSLQEAAFKEPGGEELRTWINACPNQLYSALVFQGGAAWRKRLMDEIGDQGDGHEADRQALGRRTGAADEQSRRPRSAGAARGIRTAAENDRPTCFICYTVKGFGLPMAGHKDNHAGLMTPAQMETFRERDERARRATNGTSSKGCRPRPNDLQAFLDRVPFATQGDAPPRGAACRRCRRELAITDPAGDVDADRLRRHAQRDRPRRLGFRKRIVTTSPDVTVSTNLGAVGEPAQSVRAREDGRHVQERTHPLDLQLGILAERPAHRARHRRDEPVHPARRRSACRIRSTASGCCRSARCTIRSSRAASMR